VRGENDLFSPSVLLGVLIFGLGVVFQCALLLTHVHMYDSHLVMQDELRRVAADLAVEKEAKEYQTAQKSEANDKVASLGNELAQVRAQLLLITADASAIKTELMTSKEEVPARKDICSALLFWR
jgi:hypothetical protein